LSPIRVHSNDHVDLLDIPLNQESSTIPSSCETAARKKYSEAEPSPSSVVRFLQMDASLKPEILALHDDWLVLNKPAGWLSIEGRALPDGSRSLRPVVLSWLKENPASPVAGLPVWTVHRLDRDTSGVMIFARTAQAHKKLCSAFEKRETKKVYECLAVGKPSLPFFKIDQPIEGSPSVTQVELIRQGVFGFHARVHLHTGRRHQIRIHLASRGHALWGDISYQGPKEVGGVPIPRVALHARSLEVPGAGRFEVALPEDFQAWLREVL
jgi:23S rRNA-/tRNA-specific pseudouridylate synthase